MNVNGSRFHLLLGKADWGYRLDPLLWDPTRQEVRLQTESITLTPAEGSSAIQLTDRRSATADRRGNIYWIDTDSTQLRVRSAGSLDECVFWPAATMDCATPNSDFQPVNPTVAIRREFTALAVTKDDYLVVGFISDSSSGLLSFDLMAGGPPVEMLLNPAFKPYDMIARHGGGVWILDRDNKRLWELDRHLAVVSYIQDQDSDEQAIFQPVNASPKQTPKKVLPASIDLNEIADPIAIETIVAKDSDIVLILSRHEVFSLKREKAKPELLTELDALAHDFVIAKTHSLTTPSSDVKLFVVTTTGEQAFVYDIQVDGKLSRSNLLFPLRLFAGRAVVRVGDKAYYDSGSKTFNWIPIVEQPRIRYCPDAELTTPIFDSSEPQCVWDRLMLDACIPADASVEVSCCVADEKISDQEVMGIWKTQPKPYLRGHGAELPWLCDEAVYTTQRDKGIGTWEVLLQNVRGRYLQIKLRLTGNGMVTPRLRALRVWYPRFSYAQRFLPAVYREDPIAGDFIDRFLANMEGINTNIEDHIAQAQALFDPQCAPDETLPWLAAWLDVALDPTWQEWRSRLFIKHTMDFFRWRGTVHGLRLALSLAFANCQPELEQYFAEPDSSVEPLYGIRIVEAYRTRTMDKIIKVNELTEETVGPRIVEATPQWTIEEGNDGLVKRYAQFLGNTITSADQLAAFDLAPPSDDKLESWKNFCNQQFGFIPSIGASDRQNWQHYLKCCANEEQSIPAAYPADYPTERTIADQWRHYLTVAPDINRTRWQDFLNRRYRHIKKLNAAHQTTWPAFDLITLPDRLPKTKAAQFDWLQFEKYVLTIINSAHRFSVLLPVSSANEDALLIAQQKKLAERIIELEKPAHTLFDVRFYWAFNRVGEARLGFDTLLDEGSRSPKLIPDAKLGQAYLGASFIAGGKLPADQDRYLLRC